MGSHNKIENNLRSLLRLCEEIIEDEEQKWRLSRYIKKMDIMLQELSDYETVDRTNITNYQKRIKEMKTAVNYIEPPQNALKLKERSNNLEDDGILKEIKQLNSAKYTKELRKELFDTSDSSKLLRGAANDSSENMEEYYTKIQDKLSDDMLTMTRNLKEQTLTARKIIKKDTEVVTKSTRLAHQNTGSLEKESKKLSEHNKNACKCWVWIMIALVIAIFVSMVMFMKIMKKRK
ncbi:CLUMA_CG020303, isoform A [Clunio marinus]|uniref:Vesicle transport protein USE1 n=1 Tax=Clunio marinus TaxID=568069 RepID=A0A1J1J6C0_9DIPT|nr:CLUMA_CG020303, isoform A [Clunio marinus]